ncbi:DUF6638 family protein [Patescibacteria group bacterium]
MINEVNDLKVFGLYGDGLILINTPEMVARYNQCLKDMGVGETNLESFRIDCMGWSPEIAEELGTAYYMCHGDANPMVIILTPEQRYAPIYLPYHSFDWKMMQQWFDNHAPQIRSITRYTGIWLDIDQEISEYRDPKDLLMVDGISVRSQTPSGLIAKARDQKELVRNILSEDNPVMVNQMALSLLDSAREIGDVRFKRVVIDDMQFSVTCIFYTRAFGGTFVFCGNNGSDDYFILSKNDAKSSKGVCSPNDKGIIFRLKQLGLIKYDLEWWKDNLERLEIIRDSFLMEVVDGAYPEFNFFGLNEAQQKGMIQSIKEYLPDEYFEINKLIYSLRTGKGEVVVSEKVEPFLLRPSKKVNELARDVLWHVLTLVCDGRQILRLYQHDKDEFFKLYSRWKTPRRRWSEKVIKEMYEYRMMRK